MEFEKVVKSRHSVRTFREDVIPEETLENIVRLAAATPSWENNQPWNVYIAVGESLNKIKAVWREKYAAGIQGYADMATGHRTAYSDRSQQNMAAFMADCEAKTGDKGLADFLKKNELLFNAPAVVYLTTHKGHTEWPVYDIGAFGMTLMLAAKDQGIDSIPAYEFVKFPDVLHELLGIPADEDILMGIALGYEGEDKLNDYRSDRLPLDQILTIRR